MAAAQGNFSEALEFWEVLLRTGCATEDCWSEKLRCLNRLNLEDRFDEAVTEAVRAHPQSSAVLTEAALLKVRRKHYDVAVELFASAGETASFLHEVEWMWAEHNGLLNALENRFLRNTAVLARVAAGWFVVGDFKRSLEIAEGTLALDPANVPLLIAKANALGALRRFDGVVEFASSVLKAVPGSDELSDTLARLLIRARKYDEAVEVLAASGSVDSVANYNFVDPREDTIPVLESAARRSPDDAKLLGAPKCPRTIRRCRRCISYVRTIARHRSGE